MAKTEVPEVTPEEAAFFQRYRETESRVNTPFFQLGQRILIALDPSARIFGYYQPDSPLMVYKYGAHRVQEVRDFESLPATIKAELEVTPYLLPIKSKDTSTAGYLLDLVDGWEGSRLIELLGEDSYLEKATTLLDWAAAHHLSFIDVIFQCGHNVFCGTDGKLPAKPTHLVLLDHGAWQYEPLISTEALIWHQLKSEGEYFIEVVLPGNHQPHHSYEVTADGTVQLTLTFKSQLSILRKILLHYAQHYQWKSVPLSTVETYPSPNARQPISIIESQTAFWDFMVRALTEYAQNYLEVQAVRVTDGKTVDVEVTQVLSTLRQLAQDITS